MSIKKKLNVKILLFKILIFLLLVLSSFFFTGTIYAWNDSRLVAIIFLIVGSISLFGALAIIYLSKTNRNRKEDSEIMHSNEPKMNSIAESIHNNIVQFTNSISNQDNEAERNLNDFQKSLEIQGDTFEKLLLNELKSFKFLKGSIYFEKVRIFQESRKKDIDIIMVNKKGIFVFEAKSTRAIYSDWDNPKITLTYPNGGIFQIDNPILQNRGNIRQTKLQTGFPDHWFFSLVIIGDQSDYSAYKNSKFRDPYKNFVGTRRYLKLWLEKMMTMGEDVLKQSDINLFKEKLKQASTNS